MMGIPHSWVVTLPDDDEPHDDSKDHRKCTHDGCDGGWIWVELLTTAEWEKCPTCEGSGWL